VPSSAHKLGPRTAPAADRASSHKLSSSAVETGSFQRSNDVRVVFMDGQEKRCFVSWLLILHSGHRGEGCSVGLILCKYVRSIGDFPVRSCDRILLVVRVIACSE